jgi:hypothetical protein
MAILRKRTGPVDRAVEELDRKLAALQRQMRELSHRQPRQPGNAGTASAAADSLGRFIRDMLAPPRRTVTPTYRVQRELFEADGEALKQLEAEPTSLALRPDPEPFAGLKQPGPSQEKLAHYLGAGSIKSYKPLRRVQRQARNRFFMWLGLSFAALWILWVVVR